MSTCAPRVSAACTRASRLRTRSLFNERSRPAMVSKYYSRRAVNMIGKLVGITYVSAEGAVAVRPRVTTHSLRSRTSQLEELQVRVAQCTHRVASARALA